MRRVLGWAFSAIAIGLLAGCDSPPQYAGESRDGKPHGQGTLTWPDGKKYVGEFKDGKRNGPGTFTFVDGTTYAGGFSNGKPNGKGTFTFANGQKYVSDFRDGKVSEDTVQDHPTIPNLNLLLLDPMGGG